MVIDINDIPITELIRLSGVNRMTLYRWRQNKPDLYDVVLLGCAAKLKSESKGKRKQSK